MAGVLLKQAAALGASYTLGTFNDNFFKQAALLLAVSLGYSGFQAWGTFLFVLFSAWAGWLADRFPKKYLVRRPSAWNWPPCWPGPGAFCP